MSGASAVAISVVVCTRNRAEQLRRMLGSMCALTVPPGLAWELVVVDNGSEDDTQQVIESFVGLLPIRWVFEPMPGVGNARNRGVEAARGEWLCWTDDDVLVDRGWLAAYARAIEQYPQAAVFGGRILPRLERPVPRWFAHHADEWPLDGLVAKRDFGDAPMPLALKGQRIPWGANMAIRAREQKLHGYVGDLLRAGEESHLIYRILSDGGSGWWIPDSIVTHIIPPERQTRGYLREYYRGRGIEAGFFHRAYPNDNIHGVPTWAECSVAGLVARALACRAVAAAARLAGMTRANLSFLARYAYARGLIRDRFVAV